VKRSELIQEVIDRGYNFLPTARIGTFVDRSYAAICARYNWPFLEGSIAGKAPLEITDLGVILTVYDSAQEAVIEGMDRREVEHYFPNLEEEGEPRLWYLENISLKTYPVSSDELQVRYQRVAPALAESEEPLIPEGWQYLIVDGAVVYCLKDDDEREEARALQADVNQGVIEMMQALIPRNNQNAGTVLRTGTAGTYL